MGVLRSDLITHSSLEPTGSVLFDGTGDYLTIPDHSSFAFGTADFSVECWVYFTSITGQHTLVGDTYGETAGWYWYKRSDHKLGFYYTNSNYWAGETALEADTWYHLAAVRNNGVTSMYINGVHDKSATDTTNCTVTQYYIGDTAGTTSGEIFGYISNVRITRTAVYKQNFTVPKFILDNHPGTVLLCCQSSSSAITAAVSPGTITASGNAAASAFAPDLKEDITDIGPVFADGAVFDTLSYMVPPGGRTDQRGRGRGAFAMTAAYPNTNNSISYIDIASQGIAKDFGDLTAAGRYGCGNSSATRGVSGGALGRLTTMDYFTLATTGNAVSFGTLTYNNWSQASVANSTRLIWISGNNPGSSPETNINTMTYITIATTGNGTDFGDYTDGEKARYLGGNISSPTRGLAFGGHHDPNYTSNIDYVTIATTGNSQDYGDLSQVNSGCPGCSDSTRGVIFGGYGGPSPLAALNTIDYVTIATTGNATDFGDIPAAKAYGAACSNSIRGVHCVGGYPGTDNSMSYVTIQTTGNAYDFGDLPTGETGGDSCENNNFSDSHGGIS